MINFYSFLSMSQSYGLLYVLILFFIFQIYYTLFVHFQLSKHNVIEIDSENLQPVSVIICARNEFLNLQEFLPRILTQDYPNYEVIVVNDRSFDDTEAFLTELSAEYAHLKIVTVVDSYKFQFSKKYAVTMGIKKAQNEILLFTDADCLPVSDQWIKGMQQHFNSLNHLVLGFSPYVKLQGLLNKLIRFETLFTAINYLSFALKGMPYMGVGRNMAYKRSLFFNNKGFASHMHILSGDDDLFVNEVATPDNLAIQIHPDTHMESLPKESFGAYIRQKKRHFGASTAYRSKHKRILAWQIFVQVTFHLLWITCLFFPSIRYYALAVLGLNYLIKMSVYHPIFKKLRSPDLWFWFPFLDILFTLFLVFYGIISKFIKNKTWK